MSSKSQREKLVLLQDIDNTDVDSIVPPKKRFRTYVTHKKQKKRPATGKTSSGIAGSCRKTTGVTKNVGRTAGKQAAKKPTASTCKNTLVEGVPRESEDTTEMGKQKAALRGILEIAMSRFPPAPGINVFDAALQRRTRREFPTSWCGGIICQEKKGVCSDGSRKQPASKTLEPVTDEEEEDQYEHVTEGIDPSSLSVGDWVEVESGKPNPWFGQIQEVRPGEEQPVAVRWLARLNASRFPPNLWCWRGGSHFIEVEALREVGLGLFHEVECKLLIEKRGPGKIFCRATGCKGHCQDSTAASDRPSKSQAPKSEPGPSTELLPTSSTEWRPPGETMEWEHNVEAECCTEQMPAPFTYTSKRLYNLTGERGSFVVEDRVIGRCMCKRVANQLCSKVGKKDANKLMRGGGTDGIHLAAGGCATRICQQGTFPSKLYVSDFHGRVNNMLLVQQL
ncbi:hypothetical protein CYMTET_15041 [Cymbomonas tetramitiformis]|uniref:Uncharacterized protein n=1 Tax=Cymbomonas tetramitiformis TaxID=36881 RepID=A0AAE0C6W2_9CHLO|nr:hypothetical protein CYMTET_42109 [Cymbomonas tetramitiformis]KAK3276938.1 hypothetical protein CYMTET_15041 [Cymbomonas tetramitiformis]